MATSAAVAAAAYVLGRANEQIFMCCAPSPTFDQNVRHIRIQSHTISQHTLFSFWSCELDNATIPDGEHVQFWDVTQFGVLSFSFDVDVVAAAMQMPENCERFSNLFVRSFILRCCTNNLWTNSGAKNPLKIGQQMDVRLLERGIVNVEQKWWWDVDRNVAWLTNYCIRNADAAN